MSPRPTLLFALLALGCGRGSSGPATAAAAPPATQASSGASNTASTPAPAAPSRCGGGSGMSIEGQLGTIAEPSVRRTLDAAHEDFTRCYTRRIDTVPCLSGRIELKIRVGADGAVRWVVPTDATLGDRDAERCMIERSRALRFDAPCGGEAEVTHRLSFDPPTDTRPPTVLPPTRFDAAVRAHRRQLDACRRGQTVPAMPVTFYIAPDGSVPAAGGPVPRVELMEANECVVRVVRGWRLPPLGSWWLRSTLALP